MKQYFLKSLKPENFRNLLFEKIEFSSKINCIFGENGNGKTNILEAIYLLTNKKSFKKNTNFSHYLSIDHLKPEVNFYTKLLDINDAPIKYNISLNTQKQQVYIDGLKAKKRIKLTSIFINPFDSYQFHNSATFRKDLFDNLLRKMSSEYKLAHNNFKKALKFRNKILSDKPQEFHSLLDAIEIELSHYSYIIYQKRREFLKALNPYISNTFKEIFDEKHLLEIEIERSIQFNSTNELQNFYKSNREKELIVGRTLYGIHRDNYTFIFDNMNSYEYCSLGQQKMSYFSLIFAYIELFSYNNRGVYPIVLLDDISGELDQMRWVNLIDYLQEKSFQVFITTANENFKKVLEKLKNSKRFLVINGKTTYEQ